MNLFMYFNTTKENLLNDFFENVTDLLLRDLYDPAAYLDLNKSEDRNLAKLILALLGLQYIKSKGESSEFYNEIEEILRYNGGEVFEMSQKDVLNLCYRAGFYF